jgi:hypothetical protein
MGESGLLANGGVISARTSFANPLGSARLTPGATSTSAGAVAEGWTGVGAEIVGSDRVGSARVGCGETGVPEGCKERAGVELGSVVFSTGWVGVGRAEFVQAMDSPAHNNPLIRTSRICFDILPLYHKIFAVPVSLGVRMVRNIFVPVTMQLVFERLDPL